MKTLVKSILPLVAFFFAINCFAQSPLPGKTVLSISPTEIRMNARKLRVYRSNEWHTGKHHMGAVVKNLTRGKLPTCAHSNTNNSWTNKNKAIIRTDIIEYRTNRTLWKSCNMAVSRWDDEGHDFLFTNYPGNARIPDRLGSTLWSNIYLPLERPDGTEILRKKPEVVDWRLF